MNRIDSVDYGVYREGAWFAFEACFRRVKFGEYDIIQMAP